MAQTLVQKPQNPSTPLARWSPFENLGLMSRPFDRLFEELVGRRQVLDESGLLAPAVDVLEDDQSVTVSAELPGLRKEDVQIQFENGLLSISGEKCEESEKKGRTFHRVERRFGAFNRVFALPQGANVDKAEAEFKDGVLTIRMPLREEAKPKVLKIK